MFYIYPETDYVILQAEPQEINSLLAHTLPLGQLEDSLLIGATMESVSRAYSDI